jgi:transcriptional regulator with XRE-family HTH domain
MNAKRVTTRFKRPSLRRTFIRAYRLKANMSLEKLAEIVGETTGDGFTHASLSRIERGLQPYSQPILEAIADALGTDPASLLMRDPAEPGIWSVWDQAKPGDREKIVEIAKTITGRTGTGG